MVERLKNALMQFEIKLLKGEYPNTLNASEKTRKNKTLLFVCFSYCPKNQVNSRLDNKTSGE